MAILFRTKKLKESSFTQRLLGKEPKDNAFIKINNLMAQQRNLQQLSEEEVYHIMEQYGVQPRRPQDKARLLKMYIQLLRSTFSQRQFNDLRIQELLYFKQLFAFSDRDIFHAHRIVIQVLFKQDIEQVIKGTSSISSTDLEFLRKLQVQLMLPERWATSIYKEKPKYFLQQLLHDKEKRRSLSQGQAHELQAICQSMGITASTSSATLADLQKYRLYWCIENGRAPQLSLPSHSSPLERCYLILPMQWVERRQQIRYTQYGQTSLLLKIMEGNYWRKPLSATKELATEVWQMQDKGDLCLTNKRLLFLGEQGKKQLVLAKISNFLVYKNGIDVQRKDGAGFFFELQAHADLLAMFLGHILSEL